MHLSFYIPRNDMFHNFYEMCTLVVLGTAVLYCRPVTILSHPEESNDLFIFCSAISIGMMLLVGRSLEVWWMIEGGEELSGARRASKRDAVMYAFMTLWFVAAGIYAGVQYYGSDHGSSHDDYWSDHDSIYDDHNNGYSSVTTDPNIYNNSTESVAANHSDYSEQGSHHFRLLVGNSTYVNNDENSYSGDWSIGLILAGWAVMHVLWFAMISFHIPRAAGGDYKK